MTPQQWTRAATSPLGNPGKIVGFDPDTGTWYYAAAGLGAARDKRRRRRGVHGLGNPGKIVGFDPKSGTWYFAAAGLGSPGKIVGMMQQPDGSWAPVEAAAGLGQPARSFWQLPPGTPEWMRPPDWMALGQQQFVDTQLLMILGVAGMAAGVAYEATTSMLGGGPKPRYVQAAGIGLAAAAAGWSMLRGIAT